LHFLTITPSIHYLVQKVTDSMGGTEYRCEKCDRTFDTCIRRYNVRIQMMDSTGAAFLSLFNDTAEKLIGTKADDLHNLRLAGQEEQYETVSRSAVFGF
jgi:replication factor A1